MEKKRVRRNKPKKSRKSRKAPFGRSGSGGFGIARFAPLLTAGGIVCLSLLFVLGHDVMTQGRMFAAREIVVIGNHRLAEAKVLALAGIEPGANIFSVNLGAARKRLLSDGWVAEARVGREIPDRLVIRVREHEPLALLDLGEKYVMSREGTIIKTWEASDGFSLPRVTGLTYADLPLAGSQQAQIFAALMQVFRVARASEGPLSLDRLEEIDVDRELGITLHAAGPVKSVRIGFSKYEEKYQRVDRLLASLDRGSEDSTLDITAIESDNRIVAGPF